MLDMKSLGVIAPKQPFQAACCPSAVAVRLSSSHRHEAVVRLGGGRACDAASVSNVSASSLAGLSSDSNGPVERNGISEPVKTKRRATSTRYSTSCFAIVSGAKGDSLEGVAEGKVNAKTRAGAEEQLKVLMVAGGTGGHVYPAIAIADELRRLSGDAVEVKFAGSKDRMEWRAVPRAGFEIRAIFAVPIRRPFASFVNLLVPPKLLLALFSSWQLLRQVRPHVVVGTGGYVSGPLCLVAAMMRCPVVVQEQNAYAGLTNRLLGHVAAAVFIAFSAAIPYFPKAKCVLYGNPTRGELRQYTSAAVARRFFFPKEPAVENRAQSENSDPHMTDFQESSPIASLKTRKLVVLILGGSLGAQSVNRAVAGMVATMLEEDPRRHIIWQTGPTYYEEIMANVGSNPRLAILPYLSAMHLAYAAADLVVARAGAMTCSELLVTGKPSILIPSRNVAEDHQTKNAMAMAKQGASKVLLESSLNALALAAAITEVLGDSQMLMAMTESALKAATPDASNQIAEHILRLAKHSHSVVIN